MELDPDTNTKLWLSLFKNVKNTSEIKEKLVKGELKCCVIKPPTIFDLFQVVVAANKAVTSEKLTTKSMYTEILFNLSPTKNISKSLQTFGINDKDEHILVAVIQREEDEHSEVEVLKQIDGVQISLEDLKNYTNINLIKKIYKISDKEANMTPILDSIVSRIATKDFLSF